MFQIGTRNSEKLLEVTWSYLKWLPSIKGDPQTITMIVMLFVWSIFLSIVTFDYYLW